MGLQIIKSIEEWRKIPLAERPQWFIPEDIATSYAIKECSEPLVNIEKEAGQLNVPLILAPVAPEYSERMFMRAAATKRLLNAAHRLVKKSDGKLQLKVFDTFRPLALQRKLFNKIEAEIKQREGLAGKALWERTTQFIADPELCPPHSTGGAIDLTIIDIEIGKELDMGTSVDTIDTKANTWYEDLTPQQKANRKMLFDLMTGVGFVNLSSEWWHYSHGDQYWAIFKEKPHAIYSSVESLP